MTETSGQNEVVAASAGNPRPASRRCLGVLRPLLLLLLGAPSTALANDASFGGEGADLAPIRETRVRMASEDIVIAQPAPGADRWEVTATYRFENPTDEAVELTMGFPERHCAPDDDCGFDNRFTDLRTTVRGEPVAQRVAETDPDGEWVPDLGRVYLFDVRFAPGEAVEVVHRYRMGQSGSVDGGREVLYVTRTGALWAGTIGRARFTIRTYERPWRLSFPTEYRLARYVEAVHRGHGRTEIVFEQRAWTPQRDLHVYLGHPFNGLETFAGDLDCPPPGGDAERTREAVARIDPEDLAACRNAVFAAHGRPFSSAALRRFYYRPPRTVPNPLGYPDLEFGGDWTMIHFAPNPRWSPRLLTDAERRYVRAIRARE